MISTIPDGCSFNPTLVRLALGNASGAETISARFNPTLVRLARWAGTRQLGGLTWFQSHPGSISTSILAAQELGGAAFQSHPGSISTGLEQLGSLSSSLVSIPPWFD